MLEEHATGGLGAEEYMLVSLSGSNISMKYSHRPNELIFAALLLLLVQRRGLVLLEAVVALADHTLHGRELARLLLDTHGMWLWWCSKSSIVLPEILIIFFTTSNLELLALRQEPR